MANPQYHSGYHSVSEAAYANAQRHQLHVDATSGSPLDERRRRHRDFDPDTSDTVVAQTGGRTTSPGKDFEYLDDGGDGIPSHLGPHADTPSPTSPTHRASLLQGLSPHILAWHAGRAGTLGDPVTGTHIMEPPDAELLGIDASMAVSLVEFHYDLVQNWESPRWVQANTRQFGTSGFGPFSPPSTSGPNITEIQKQLVNWDKLTDLSPAGWQIFYNKLRRGCRQWKIALMPFEAINLKYECQGHGLCVCGLGLTRWKKMGDALFTVLEYLLPTTNAIIYTTMTSLANTPSSLPNGYELLWILLKEFIPMFDTSQPAPLPEWPISGDIFEFGRLVLMYCDLARHRTSTFTEAMKSRLFLCHVKGVYLQLAQPYLALVNTYCPGRDGIVRCSDPLPHHLTVLELARSFYDARPAVHTTGPSSTTTGSHAYATHILPPDNVGGTYNSQGGGSRVSQTFAFNSPHQSAVGGGPPHGMGQRGGFGVHAWEPAEPSLSHTSHSDTPSSLTPSTSRPTHIQGFSVNYTRRQQGQQQQGLRRGPPNPTRRDSHPPRAVPRHEAPCDACGKYGHPAARCDMLAMALFLQRYSRDRNNAAIIKEAEERWVQRNKKFLPRDNRSPQTILANYCAELEFSEDQVDAELDWDFLVDPDDMGETEF
jgi:hypothetical protein